jgi:DUF971 family protein
MPLTPTKISRPRPFLLEITWSDGYNAMISLETLRRDCPCAVCAGEQIGNMVYSKPVEIKIEPGVFDLTELSPIGNYALNAKWANGHSTGIYTFELLRNLCEHSSVSEIDIERLEEKHNKEKKKIQLNVMKLN